MNLFDLDQYYAKSVIGIIDLDKDAGFAA